MEKKDIGAGEKKEAEGVEKQKLITDSTVSYLLD